MSRRFASPPAATVTGQDGTVVLTMPAREARLLAASIALTGPGGPDHLIWLDALAAMLGDAVSRPGSSATSDEPHAFRASPAGGSESLRVTSAAVATAAARVASAVLPGHEAEARRAAVLVADIATEAASSTAERTALAAATAARTAADAALEAAADAADAAMQVELEVHSAARTVRATADRAAALVAVETYNALELVGA